MKIRKSPFLTARRKIAPHFLPQTTFYFSRTSPRNRLFSFCTVSASFLCLQSQGTAAFTFFASAASPSNHFHQQQRNQYHTMSCGRTHITERDGSGTITVSPRNEAKQSGLVVISHGLGDSAEGFADVAEQFAAQYPWLKIILPTAPTQKVTMNMGMSMPSWYDIVGLDERSNEHCAGIEESQARIAGILQKEHETTGLPYSRYVL